jgi:hypothetical protein
MAVSQLIASYRDTNEQPASLGKSTHAVNPACGGSLPLGSLIKVVKGTVQQEKKGSGPNYVYFERSSLKSEERRFLEESARRPCCESPIKLQRPLLQLLENRKKIPNGAHRSVSGLLSS